MCLTFLSATSFSSWAEDDHAEDKPLEEVQVLGSHIPRKDYTSISPVFTLGPEDLALEHRETLAELLSRYPQFVPDRNSTSTSLGSEPGVSSINLRGLGSQRNLLLIDGRRLGPSGTTGIVDTNMLPVSLLESVEILTGGASTTYGADAMSGVVNFQLRKQVEGVELGGSFERTDQGDGETYNFFALGGTGFAGERGQITGFISHFDRDGILHADREISAQPIAEDRSDGSLFVGGTTGLPEGHIPLPAEINGNLAPSGLRYDQAGDPVAFQFPDDLYDGTSSKTLDTSMRRTGLGLFSHYELSDDIILSASLLHSRNEVNQQWAPTPVFMGNLRIDLSNPLLSEANREALASNFDPQNRGFVDVPYNYRATQAGNREIESQTDNTWFNLEATGRWLDDWRWTAAYTDSDYNSELEQADSISPEAFQQAVLVNPETGGCFDTTGGCSPANVFGAGRLSDAALAFITVPTHVSTGGTSQRVVSLQTHGFVDILWLTDIGAALGLEWRRDQSKFRPDPQLLNQAGFWNQEPLSGEDEVSEIYGELLLPLLQNIAGAQLLEWELGARYSDYSKVGGEWTWKTGANWVPVNGLRIRASYNRAARAPNIEESYRGHAEGPNFLLGATFNDPCTASNHPEDVPGRAALCIQQGIDPESLATFENPPVVQYTDSISGNLDLEVEVADTYTLGLVWTPASIDKLSMTVDYYDIEISDYIRVVGQRTAFQLCYVDRKFCPGIERQPEGQISKLFGTYYNTNSLSTTGVDLTLSYTWNHKAPWSWPSSLGISTVVNWTKSFEITGDAGSFDCTGRFGSPCNAGATAIRPEYRSMSSIDYRTGPLSATLSWQWLDGTDTATGILAPTGTPPEPVAVPSLDSESYFDLNFGWHWDDRLSLSFAVINFTDTSPPLLGRHATGANTDPASYDILGRRYQASMQLRF